MALPAAYYLVLRSGATHGAERLEYFYGVQNQTLDDVDCDSVVAHAYRLCLRMLQLNYVLRVFVVLLGFVGLADLFLIALTGLLVYTDSIHTDNCVFIAERV